MMLHATWPSQGESQLYLRFRSTSSHIIRGTEHRHSSDNNGQFPVYWSCIFLHSISSVKQIVCSRSYRRRLRLALSVSAPVHKAKMKLCNLKHRVNCLAGPRLLLERSPVVFKLCNGTFSNNILMSVLVTPTPSIVVAFLCCTGSWDIRRAMSYLSSFSCEKQKDDWCSRCCSQVFATVEVYDAKCMCMHATIKQFLLQSDALL